MQDHQLKTDIIPKSSSRQSPCTEEVTQQIQQIVVKDTAKDEAKTKQIARSILNSSLKRLRRDRQQSNLMQEYLDSVLKMVGELRFARPSKLLRKDMSMQQTDVLIEELKERMETIVNRSKLKKKAILEMMRSLEGKELHNREINQLLIQTRKEATQRKKWLHYLKDLQEKISELDGNSNKIQENVQFKERALHCLKGQIAKKVSESITTKQMIKAKQEDIQRVLSRQRQLQRQYAQLSSKKIPYRSEMIRCMFLVAMLCEQNYVYSLKKKHKWSEKSMPASQASEKFSKVYQNLKDRTISIDCNKSLLTHIRTLSAIYIHCKSLELGISFINNYSFFSAQYRPLYNYQFYERYLNILVQKTRLNKEWSRMRNELHQNASKACKIKLVINAKQQQVEFLRYINQVFLEDSGYFIHLGDKVMRIEIKAEDNEIAQDEQQQQICYLKMDLQHLGA